MYWKWLCHYAIAGLLCSRFVWGQLQWSTHKKSTLTWSRFQWFQQCWWHGWQWTWRRWWGWDWSYWNDQSSQQEQPDDDRPNAILKAIYFFLLFFQLKFHVPDCAIIFLLAFLKGLLLALSSLVPSSTSIIKMCQNIPQSLQILRRRFSNRMSTTKEFVVCPKCFTLYNHDDCIVSCGGMSESRKCSYVEYPNHPQRCKRAPCNTPLMKRIKCGHTYKLVPKKALCITVFWSLKKYIAAPRYASAL